MKEQMQNLILKWYQAYDEKADVEVFKGIVTEDFYFDCFPAPISGYKAFTERQIASNAGMLKSQHILNEINIDEVKMKATIQLRWLAEFVNGDKPDFICEATIDFSLDDGNLKFSKYKVVNC
ncbi:MAG: hypothetical protein WCI30_04175 [Clostridia bacterium]